MANKSAAEQAATVREFIDASESARDYGEATRALDALVARCEQAEQQRDYWEELAIVRGQKLEDCIQQPETGAGGPDSHRTPPVPDGGTPTAAEQRLQQLETALKQIIASFPKPRNDAVAAILVIARAALETAPSPDKEKAA